MGATASAFQVELTWGNKTLALQNPWGFTGPTWGSQVSTKVDIEPLWNLTIAERLVDSLSDQHMQYKQVALQVVARILRFGPSSMLDELDRYGLFGCILDDFKIENATMARHILEILCYFTKLKKSAVEEMIEYDMVWIIYDIMDRPQHITRWKLITNGLIVLSNIAETQIESHLTQKWKSKYEAESTLYKILLAGLAAVQLQSGVVPMLIQLSSCITSMMTFDNCQNSEDVECIRNLGTILLLCGIIPNQQIWSNISHVTCYILMNNTMSKVYDLVRKQICKPMYRDWHVSLQIMVIDGLKQWIDKEDRKLNGRIVGLILEVLLKHIRPVEEMIESILSLLTSICQVQSAPIQITPTNCIDEISVLICYMISTTYL